jgi:hypothetical protein
MIKLCIKAFFPLLVITLISCEKDHIQILQENNEHDKYRIVNQLKSGGGAAGYAIETVTAIDKLSGNKVILMRGRGFSKLKITWLEKDLLGIGYERGTRIDNFQNWFDIMDCYDPTKGVDLYPIDAIKTSSKIEK